MWCGERKIGYGQITVSVVCSYLLFLFNSKNPSGKAFPSGALNNARSAISFFVKYKIPRLGFQPPVVMLFNYFHKRNPSFPRYPVTWDVSMVLKFLANWHPKESLT